MSAADEILADLPLDQLAARLGTDEATAEQAVRSALPALFGGLQANVTSDSQGPISLAQALTQHSDPRFFDGGVSLGDIDTGDGQAIVRHIFANSPEQAQVLQASSAGVGGSLISKLLPILAPIVMAYIAKKLGMGSAGQQQQRPSEGGLGGLGDLLGPILGGMFGGGSSSGQPGSTGGLGDMRGQILAGQPPHGGQPRVAEAPVEQHQGGQWTQPQFNPPGEADGGITMPTVEEDPRDSGSSEQQQKQQPGGLGDLLGGIFGR